MSKISKQSTEALYKRVALILNEARSRVLQTVNSTMVRAYWEIGRLIVEHEQKGKTRAGYGDFLIKGLSERLTVDFGKGFTPRNLWYMKNFYLAFPKVNALRSLLGWTHYRLLLKVENIEARGFYEVESIKSRWSSRELDRQINSLLFERLALSKDKKQILRMAREGQAVSDPRDLIKDPYVLEFLNIKENTSLLEKDLESNLINKLHKFLLELGRGFAFIARQKRITVDGDHFYIDLVFYNYLLKCFVLIDLKIGKLTHGDIGQMDFYMRYFEGEEKKQGDNPTIGLILCSNKNNTMVKYTLLSGSKQMFASKYKLYLPSKQELKSELQDGTHTNNKYHGNMDNY
ncbi:MAG: PDDEXK nuclease domain-containing protein [Candidatus Omnitrophica bacterium]|nr:PDDEXK nuclease domain-containing protein [Candidatus Omnitrophota bacterium]